jgi:probable F420-dependent oxidoreductase
MQLGVTIHATDLAMDVAELAREAEARGFHSLYVPEHTHIPASRRTPPPTGTPELEQQYYRSPDPIVALAAAAALTQRILLGTGIALPAQHDPISYAKQIATLDRIARGRFVLGIGFGWNEDEMENHGVDPRRRRAHTREAMLAMQALWSNELASYQGEFVRFTPSYQWPKPVQQPRPRVLIGGAAGPQLFAHIAEYGDGWMPIGGAGIQQALPALRRSFEERGRDAKALHVVPMGVLPDAAKLAHYREAGVTECVLRLPSAPRDVVMPVLDAFARLLPR